jgi:gluconolactonase
LLCVGAIALAQNYDQIQAERIVDHMKYGDGVVWSHDGFLLFADTGANKIYRLDPGEKPKTGRENSGGAEGLASDSQGRLYVCESANRRVTRTDRKGDLQVIAASFEGKKLNGPDDITVRKDGQIYFTDPAFGSRVDDRELQFNGVFHVTPKGEIDALARWTTRPNGIALSADGKTLYVSDSDRHAVVAFDLDGRGNASNPRDLITNIRGVPGGLRLDASGRIYITARGLGIYSHEGKLEHTLLGEEITTNCAFGDPDFETLYVLGREQLFRLRLGVKGAAQ